MTTAILRPNATITAGTGVAYTGGATWTAVTADDSDATWAELPTGSVGLLGLTTTTLPAGAWTKTVKVRMRIRSASATTKIQTWLVDSSGLVYAWSSAASQSTTITTISGAATSVNVFQSDVDAWRLRAAVSGATAGRYVELYVDLVYATLPVCAVSTPTGASTTTSRPEVAWTHTAGSDGGPQARYRVVIFTAAQYGVGGFDPSSSPSTYDTDMLSGATSSLTPDSLPNGTYRAYVQTAQIVNGANHWADWAFSAFTVSVTGPAVSSVVPTAGSGSIAVVVNRNTGGAAWEWVTVERSADSGTTWEFVRGASLATATGNTFNVTDYEAPHTTSVIYRAQATMTDAGTGELKEGAWVSSSSVSWTHTRPWVKTIDDPTLNTTADLAEAPEFEYPRRVGVFDVLGSTHPVTVADVGGARRGTLVMQTDTSAERTALKAVLDSDMPVLVQFSSAWGIDQGWFTVTGYTCRHLDPVVSTNGMRRWNLGVVEVDRPPDATE